MQEIQRNIIFKEVYSENNPLIKKFWEFSFYNLINGITSKFSFENLNYYSVICFASFQGILINWRRNDYVEINKSDEKRRGKHSQIKASSRNNQSKQYRDQSI